MKFKYYYYFFVLTIFFALLSCAGSQKEEMDLAQVRKAIEEENLKLAEAYRQGDAAAVAALYTEDATILPQDSEMVRGRQGIEEYFSIVMQMGVKDIIVTTVDVFGSGDLAYEIGQYTLQIQPEGQEPTELIGKYVSIWKLQADGSWKMHVDISNSS